MQLIKMPFHGYAHGFHWYVCGHEVGHELVVVDIGDGGVDFGEEPERSGGGVVVERAEDGAFWGELNGGWHEDVVGVEDEERDRCF